MLCIKNKQNTPIGPCFCMRTSIRNRKIGGSVTLATGELAYFVDDFFALVLYNLTSTVKNKKQHYNQTHFYNHTILTKSTLHNSL